MSLNDLVAPPMERFYITTSTTLTKVSSITGVSSARGTIYHPVATWLNKLGGFRVNSFSTHLTYFLSLSLLGYILLKSFNTTTAARSLDLFFTAVSAATESSMSVVEMEAFSLPQLLVITFLMFGGGDIFLSLLALFLEFRNLPGDDQLPVRHDDELAEEIKFIKRKSIRFLCFMLLTYLTTVHVVGILSLLSYLALHKGAANILSQRGFGSFTFSLFTVVSTFANCGFIPTNENMILFGKNSGLLLLLIPLILLGNTMFPPCLRICLWLAAKFFPNANGKEYSKYLLRNTAAAKGVLLPGKHSAYLAATVAGFVMVQVMMFCALNWNMEAMRGWSSFEKLVGGTFMAVNSRHSGESAVDLSSVSPAVLVLFLLMMYLPPYTVFLPTDTEGKDKVVMMIDDEETNLQPLQRRGQTPIPHPNNKEIIKSRNFIVDNVFFSQLCFLLTFVIMVCITERDNLQTDPLNFNVFNIALEVVSAYGNVGFSMGYSCKKQINPTGNCEEKCYSLCGRWSDEGKIILIIVMLFGKLKKFNLHGGKAWKLS